MKNILIQHGRVINPANAFDGQVDIAIADGRILAMGKAPAGFVPDQTLDASDCLVLPGLVDLAARLRAPGTHGHILESEMAAAVAGGITSLVCPPDTEPVLDEPGLVEMLKFRSAGLQQARLFPLGALTRNLQGEVLTGMVELSEAGCVGFSQAEVPIKDTQILLRALQYAATFGYTVWLRPQDPWLGKGVAASGALATRMGLSGVPVLAETLALMTLVALVEASGARVHLCRISSAQGVELVRQAKARGLPITCDVSINSLHLCENDIGYFDSRARLTPPLRGTADRDALRAGLLDGTIDALVSDHTPVDADAKILPFSDAKPGASGLELLLSLALHWARQDKIALPQALAALTSRPAEVLGASRDHATPSIGHLQEGSVADLCIVNPDEEWQVGAHTLRSSGKYTPFEGVWLPGRIRHTLVGGQPVFAAEHASTTLA
ncbi:MAG: dihydroorotase [Brachymonas sp.]|nr:dihydroorotase [Brachymonas sp.]